MTDTKTHNRSGTLTAYALACGYVERETRGDSWAQLFHEHAHYQVRAHDGSVDGSLTWESYALLSDARRAYRSAVRLIGA